MSMANGCAGMIRSNGATRRWGRFLAGVVMGLGLLTAGPAAATVLQTTVTAVPQRYPSVTAVEVDFASLLLATGSAEAFDPASVEVADAQGTPLPVKVSAADKIYRVAWEVPPAGRADEAGRAASFSLKFGSGQGRSSALAVPENLVYNGHFALLSTEGIPVPLTAPQFQANFTLAKLPEGGHALAFNGDANRRSGYTTPWIQIQGGSTLLYEVTYQTRGAQAHHYNQVLYSFINFRDAAGKSLPRQGAFSTRAADSDGWQTKVLRVVVPAETAATNFELNCGSSIPGSVLLREVRIVPEVAPEVTAATTAAGERVSLTADGEHIYRFDLGPDKAPVMSGFTALTPSVTYQAESGYGFTRLARPFVQDKERPDALGRDYVAGVDVRFRLDLPNGDYRVWLLTGDSQASGVVMSFFFDQHCAVNGNEVYSDTTAPADLFKTWNHRNYDKFWLPGMDYHDAFMAPRFKELQFPVTVSKGRMELAWRNMPVCALLIYPAAAEKAVTGELSWLAGRRRREHQMIIKPGPAEVATAPTGREKRQGFMLFRRPANEDIFPESRPQAGERIDALKAFGAPGQTVAAHFSLYPLRDLGEIQVRLNGLRRGREAIGAEAVEVRVVRYIHRSLDGGVFQISPFLLDRREKLPVSAETTWSWYVLVHLPEAVAAGDYRGEVEISAAAGGRVLAELPIQVTVLPFRLAELPIAQGYYYFPSEPWYATFWGANVVGKPLRGDPAILELIRQNEVRELRFMKALGLNSVSFGDDLRGDLKLGEDGEVSFNPDNRLAFWMDLYAAEKMGPMPFYGFQSIGSGVGGTDKISWLDRNNAELQKQFSPAWNQAYQSLVRAGMRLQQERGWPEILWYLTDERSNYREAGAKEGVELGKLLRGIPGATSIASMNGPWEHIMVPHVDISMPNIAFPITAETVKLVADSGSKLWLYNCGSERLTLGLYPWRVQAGGRFQWHYRQQGGEQWDDGAGRGSSKYSISYMGPDEVVPALPAQVVREAIYDHRYVATLEQAMQAARQRLEKAANPRLAAQLAKADEFIAFLRSRVPIDAREVIGFNIDPRAAGAAVGGEFRNTDNLDRVRWGMAELIMSLQGGDQ